MKARSILIAVFLIAFLPHLLYSQTSPETVINKEINISMDEPGPWVDKGLSEYQFDGFFADSNTVFMPHGVAVDKKNRIWIGNYGSGKAGLIVKTPGGDHTSFSPITEVTVNGTRINLTDGDCRGMAVAKDGNILYAKGPKLIKINSTSGLGIALWDEPTASNLTNPCVDGEGNIYVGKIVGVNPIYIIDGNTLETRDAIIIPRAPKYSRSVAVSEDATTIWVGDLGKQGIGEYGGPLYKWTSTDYVNYVISDSISANTNGEPIFTTQRVIVNYGPNQKFYVSHDNSYEMNYNPVNALIVFDFSKYEYVNIPMPYLGEDIGNGPRNFAFSNSGDTIYVAGFSSNTIMRFVKTLSPEIKILMPNGGENIGCNTTISWTSNNVSGNVKIEYYCNNLWDTIVSSTPNDGSYEWNIPKGTVCSSKIKIIDLSNTGCWDMSDDYFNINCDGSCNPPYVKAGEVEGAPGLDIDVPISIKGNVTPINAFGFEFNYCNDKLHLLDVEKGILTSDFDFFQYEEQSPGNVIIGGFHTSAIPANSDDVIAIVKLHVDACVEGDICELQINDLVDDFMGMNACNGTFSCVTCKLGDVNDDGNLTPGDALCAFNIYLHGGTPNPGTDCDNECALYAADINCTPDGITPGDALYIFEGYLQGKTPPMDCKPTVLSKTDNNLDMSINSLEGDPDEEVVFSIKLDQPVNINAFGFDIGYPTELLTFIGIKKADITKDWKALNSHVNVDGVVTIGGYSIVNNETYQSGDLVDVVFKVNQDADGSGELWLFNPTDDLACAQSRPARFSTSIEGIRRLDGLEVPDSYHLEQNYPNPFNMDTEIIYQLPEPGFVTITIYNSVGHQIRSLVNQHQSTGKYAVRWDGKDDHGIEITSGVYIYHMKSKKYSMSKKMLLIK